ncbi:MAG: alpha/beta fold hydrolase [bacterium]|nr:alpha/beta fold hydrolase [bacterium]
MRLFSWHQSFSGLFFLASLFVLVVPVTASTIDEQTSSTGSLTRPANTPTPESGTSKISLDEMDRVQDLKQQVTRSLARYFGIPESNIQPTLRFEEDLHADPFDAFEIVQLICDEHQVPVPENHRIKTQQDLVAHIVKAEQNRGNQIMGNQDAIKEFIVQTIFYATTRAVDDPKSPTTFYGGKRAAVDRNLHVGTCEVTIPVLKHKPGNLESPSFCRLEFKPDSKKHIVLRRINPMEESRFWTLLNDGLANGRGGTENDLLVFIHGFNVSFSKAARRTAQMSYDLGFQGAPLVFSWPSNGSLLGYLSDREDVEWSVSYLVDFLLELRQKSGAENIHLMAHSMGSQALLRALHRIALMNGDENPLFENVILAAPDFDTRTFAEDIFPTTFGLAERWTLYASNKDTALDASRVLSDKRLGTPLAVAEGMDVIDATGVEVTPWNVPEFHSYYASKLRVMADIGGVLQQRGPSLRNLLPKKKGVQSYWIISMD